MYSYKFLSRIYVLTRFWRCLCGLQNTDFRHFPTAESKAVWNLLNHLPISYMYICMYELASDKDRRRQFRIPIS